jgi:hypothetical protein
MEWSDMRGSCNNLSIGEAAAVQEVRDKTTLDNEEEARVFNKASKGLRATYKIGE